MRHLRFFLVSLCIYALVQFYKSYFETRFVSSVTFQDVLGNERKLGPGRVAVVGFWISPCGYSDRMLKILKSIRSEYREEDLDVIGFYLNPTSNDTLLKLKPPADYPLIFAAAQQRHDLIAKLHREFHIRGGGSDVYVVDRTGKIHVIDVSNGKRVSADLLKEVEHSLTKNVPGLVAKMSVP
jgi:thiol-disulfide isomerase/thioredoxin